MKSSYFLIVKVLFISLQMTFFPSQYSQGTNRFKCTVLITKNVTNGNGSGFMYLYKFSCISSSVVCNHCRVDSMCKLLEMDLWGGLEREKEVYKFHLTEANIPFDSLGDNKVQCKSISSLASAPGSFHSGSYHIGNVTTLHNEQGPARGHHSVKFPLSYGLGT